MERISPSPIEHNDKNRVVKLSFSISPEYRILLRKLIESRSIGCPLKNHKDIPYLTDINVEEIWNNAISECYNSYFTNNIQTNLNLTRPNKDQIERILSYLIIFCAKYKGLEHATDRSNYNINIILPKILRIHNKVRKNIASCFGTPKGTNKMQDKMADIIEKKADEIGFNTEDIEHYLALFLDRNNKNILSFDINDIKEEEKRENFLCDFYSIFALKALFHEVNRDKK